MEKEQILDFGWEVMKHMEAPHIFLWLASEGWVGASEVYATRADPENVKVQLKFWPTAVLPADYHRN